MESQGILEGQLGVRACDRGQTGIGRLVKTQLLEFCITQYSSYYDEFDNDDHDEEDIKSDKALG